VNDASATAAPRVKLPLGQVLQILGPWALRRLSDQVKAVWLIVLYLVAFQTLLLDIPIFGATVIAAGVVLVVVGLSFFMEGLLLGLMPLGELIGIKLPQKSKLPTILGFAFVLGVGATFAEPAVGILKLAGAGVRAWDAPLLFLMLNRHSDLLVYAVGAGVGVAVVFGMLRFLYGWSLKPFIYVLVPLLLALTVGSAFEPNMIYITGLAWDCGGVTTGPVTVPLVLALGIGVCRVVAREGSGGTAGGFGVVTLASAFPIIGVLLLGLALLPGVPQPMSEAEFLAPSQRAAATALFESPQQLAQYVRQHASPAGQSAFFGADAAGASRVGAAATPASTLALGEIAWRNTVAALQAIVPLCLLFFAVLWLVLRERVPRLDELGLGVAFAVIGMAVFSMGIELGLSRLGGQVGDKLPAAFKSIELSEQRQVIESFDPALVQTALTADGRQERFFYLRHDGGYTALPYVEANHDTASGRYTYTPTKGPLYGDGSPDGSPDGNRLAGVLVVLAFAFAMGYGATLAEPALNALGRTVEDLTAGSFRKSQLMQAVALGVGLGMVFGVAKIVWAIPLVWLLAPPYLLLLWLTQRCDEGFVNIAWDSAGVTTGPITVPLVLAMGLGIGSQVGVVEGFGILAMASVWPIVAVLCLSLWVGRRRARELRAAARGD